MELRLSTLSLTATAHKYFISKSWHWFCNNAIKWFNFVKTVEAPVKIQIKAPHIAYLNFFLGKFQQIFLSVIKTICNYTFDHFISTIPLTARLKKTIHWQMWPCINNIDHCEKMWLKKEVALKHAEFSWWSHLSKASPLILGDNYLECVSKVIGWVYWKWKNLLLKTTLLHYQFMRL